MGLIISSIFFVLYFKNYGIFRIFIVKDNRMKKIIITNEQLMLLSKVITENSNKDDMVRKMKTELSKYYEPSVGVQREGGEYFDKPMILNKVSGEMITDEAVFKYLSYKPAYNGLNEDFIKQVIRDWFGGNLKNTNELTRNVTM